MSNGSHNSQAEVKTKQEERAKEGEQYGTLCPRYSNVTETLDGEQLPHSNVHTPIQPHTHMLVDGKLKKLIGTDDQCRTLYRNHLMASYTWTRRKLAKWTKKKNDVLRFVRMEVDEGALEHTHILDPKSDACNWNVHVKTIKGDKRIISCGLVRL